MCHEFGGMKDHATITLLFDMTSFVEMCHTGLLAPILALSRFSEQLQSQKFQAVASFGV